MSGMEEENRFVLGATVATGFERTALDECVEKLGHGINAVVDRGRVYFEVSQSQLKQALDLRTVDHLFVVVKQLKGLDLHQGKDEALQELCRYLTHSDWLQAVEAWTHFRGVQFFPILLDNTTPCPAPNQDPSCVKTPQSESDSPMPSGGDSVQTGNNPPSQENAPENPSKTSDQLPPSQPYLPTFRVTGHRVGDHHNFSSQEAAGKLGEYLIQRYGWPVQMKNFEMEVLVNVKNDNATIGINLTEESMHKRNIVHFGPTTLRSTLAHCMLRLGEPQLGDVICDPMCGGGSIPLEGALNWPCYVLGGDNHDIACLHASGNVTATNEKRRLKGRPGLCVDVLQWDVTNLPLRSDSVDLIVSDMPFGKRMGSRLNNWELYRRSLLEMGRVCQQGTGKAVLLTQDKKCMAKILVKVSSVWRKQLQLTINIGGLFACVYVLKRRGKAKKIADKGMEGGERQEST